MKTNIITLLFIFTSMYPVWGWQPVSLEDFKKIDSAVEREKIIAQAPPEQRGELIDADIHLMLLADYGEVGLKFEKERRLSKTRGLGDLEEAFNQEWALLDAYYSQVLNGAVSPALTKDEQSVAGKQITSEKNLLSQRNLVVHSLVYAMMASPQALELDGEAKKILAEMRPTIFDGHAVTKEVLNNVSRQLDQLFEKMKQLPTMSPAQIQKEYDDMPEVGLLKR